jgi:hypothetical protein
MQRMPGKTKDLRGRTILRGLKIEFRLATEPVKYRLKKRQLIAVLADSGADGVASDSGGFRKIEVFRGDGRDVA